jgi:hypothetical protein
MPLRRRLIACLIAVGAAGLLPHTPRAAEPGAEAMPAIAPPTG